jgi:hypothetical protein
MSLSYYALSASVFFWMYLKDGAVPDNGRGAGLLVLAGVAAALCLWTKMEGMFFPLAFGMAVMSLWFARRHTFRAVVLFLLPVAVIAVIWYVFLLVKDIRINYGEGIIMEAVKEGGMPGVLPAMKKNLHFEVLPVIWDQIMFSANFNMAFFFLMVLCVSGWKVILRSDLKYLFVVLTCVIVMFLFVYIGTDSYQYVMSVTAINRNILTYIPMMYFLSAVTALKVLGEKGKN